MDTAGMMRRVHIRHPEEMEGVITAPPQAATPVFLDGPIPDEEIEKSSWKPSPIREYPRNRHRRRRSSTSRAPITVYATCQKPCCLPSSSTKKAPSIPQYMFLVRLGYEPTNYPALSTFSVGVRAHKAVWSTIGTFTDLWTANTTAELACFLAAFNGEIDEEGDLTVVPALAEGDIEKSLMVDNLGELAERLEAAKEKATVELSWEETDVQREFSEEGGAVLRMEFGEFEVLATVERLRTFY